MRYLPGQFFFITIKVKGEDAIHHFSFSSSPTDRGHIEFTKRITAKKLPYNVVLLYGNNNFEDIAFREELDAMAAANTNIRVEYVLSGPVFPPGLQGKTGFINQGLVRELVPDFAERLFYISGPPRMVIALEEQLTGLPVPDKQIKRDSFTGYD